MAESFSSYYFSLAMGKREIQKEFTRNFGLISMRMGQKIKGSQILKYSKLS